MHERNITEIDLTGVCTDICIYIQQLMLITLIIK
nr:hypothetical protein [Snodgrassella communis]